MLRRRRWFAVAPLFAIVVMVLLLRLLQLAMKMVTQTRPGLDADATKRKPRRGGAVVKTEITADAAQARHDARRCAIRHAGRHRVAATGTWRRLRRGACGTPGPSLRRAACPSSLELHCRERIPVAEVQRHCWPTSQSAKVSVFSSHVSRVEALQAGQEKSPKPAWNGAFCWWAPGESNPAPTDYETGAGLYQGISTAIKLDDKSLICREFLLKNSYPWDSWGVIKKPPESHPHITPEIGHGQYPIDRCGG